MRYRVPFDLLEDDLKADAVRTLFPEDRADAEGWRHTVKGAGALSRGSLWDVARWFTGRGETFVRIRAFNRLPEDDLRAGQEW